MILCGLRPHNDYCPGRILCNASLLHKRIAVRSYKRHAGVVCFTFVLRATPT